MARLVFELKQSNQTLISHNCFHLLIFRVVYFLLLSFYTVNEVHKFQYSKPVRKGEKDPDNEFAVRAEVAR